MQAQPAVLQTVKPPQRAFSQSTAVAGTSYPCQRARQRSRNTWASHGRPPRRCPGAAAAERSDSSELSSVSPQGGRRFPLTIPSLDAKGEVCATVALLGSTTTGALAIAPPSDSLVHHGGSFADSPDVGFRALCATRSVARRSHSHQPSASPVGLRSSARSLIRTRYAHPRPGRKAPEDLCGKACARLSRSWSGADRRNKRRRAHELGHRDQALRSDHREKNRRCAIADQPARKRALARDQAHRARSSLRAMGVLSQGSRDRKGVRSGRRRRKPRCRCGLPPRSQAAAGRANSMGQRVPLPTGTEAAA